MTTRAAWALRLEASCPARLAGRLGPLRLLPGLEVCADLDAAGGGAVWLRGATPLEADPGLERLLRASGGQRFVVDPATDEVRAPGRRLPAGALPAGPWVALPAFLRPASGVVASSALPASRAALTLTRGLACAPAAPGPETPEPTALRVARDVFVAWALTAPQVRLAPLEVAARADAPELLVRGRPLPPLPGERLVVTDGVAVAVGLLVRPALDAATLRAALGLERGDLGLLTAQEAGPGAASPAVLERVEARWFVPASRAQARALGRGVEAAS